MELIFHSLQHNGNIARIERSVCLRMQRENASTLTALHNRSLLYTRTRPQQLHSHEKKFVKQGTVEQSFAVFGYHLFAFSFLFAKKSILVLKSGKNFLLITKRMCWLVKWCSLHWCLVIPPCDTNLNWIQKLFRPRHKKRNFLYPSVKYSDEKRIKLNCSTETFVKLLTRFQKEDLIAERKEKKL